MRALVSVALLLGACHEPDEPAIDEPRWTPVEGLEDCAVERLEKPTAEYAAAWSSCGPDCRTRRAVPPALEGDVAERGSSAAQEHDGEVFLRTSIAGTDARHEIIERLGTDTPDLVLRMSADCRVTSRKTGAALLVEAFRDPSAHLVAIYSPPTRSLEVHPEHVAVALPVAGWFVADEGWGVVDAAGVRQVQPGRTATLATSTAWLLAPRAGDERVAWIDTGIEPASVVQHPTHRWQSEGDVAAFGWVGSARAWLEVAGADTLAGRYEHAKLRWPEGAATLDGEVAGGVALGIDATHVGLTTSGDGDAIAASFIRVERASGTLERIAVPPGRFHNLAVAAEGHWLLQDVSEDRLAHFDAWIDR